MPKKLDRDKIKEMVKNGKKDAEIATELNCSAGSIQQIRLNELGFKRGVRTKLKEKRRIAIFLQSIYENPIVLRRQLEEKTIFDAQSSVRETYQWLRKNGFPVQRRSILEKNNETTEKLSGKQIFYHHINLEEIPNSLRELELLAYKSLRKKHELMKRRRINQKIKQELQDVD